ncbi:MAG: hypothetical protein QME66_13415 [Candidatus Eisenbacteria bacterium]|nr:hypothetical protein [Candidatus Eisenbacteria bacterium]
MRLRILFACCLLGPSLLHGETSVWTRIEELLQHDTPQGNPQLEAYLKTLTRPQMIEAARECCKKAEARVPEATWEGCAIPVSIALLFYVDADGGLAKDALNSLFDCIASEKEGQLIRESLVGLLRQRYWRQLTTDQRKQCKQKFFTVLSDKNAPVRLRALTCRELSLAIAENHRDIILSDKNVRPLRNDKQKWWNLDDLIRKGEVRLDPETRKALKTLRKEIQDITPTLTALSQDAAESPEVGGRAKGALKTFADLPVVPEQ